MAYKTIFDTKPKRENTRAFCKRITMLLNSIKFYIGRYIYNDGKKMLNEMFKHNKLNKGYANIDDLLFEANPTYKSVFDLCESGHINENVIFANIDIIANCLYSFKEKNNASFYNKEEAHETIMIIFEAMNQYLLSCGYKLILIDEESKFSIIENEIVIDINEIKDEQLKKEIINFYDYRNATDIKEKKKILLNLIGDLESRKKDISELLGNDIANMFSNYSNNFNLRHDNINPEYKKYYNKTIAELKKNEILKWYDYIFVFMINTYINLDVLKKVNINGGYK